MKITILDPALCCSTGVCGQEVDDALVQTSSNVKWLKSLGYEVYRYNISNDSDAFKQFPAVIEKLQKQGVDSLPYILINNQMVMSGAYPSREEWTKLLAMDTPQSKSESDSAEKQDLQKTEILVAIGAALAAANEKALNHYLNLAKEMELDGPEISRAMNIGNDVRQELSQEIIKQANTFLKEMQPAQSADCSGTGCC